MAIEASSVCKSLEVIAQPCYSSRLRYRSDYNLNRNRRGVLYSRNNQNYQSPTVLIPQEYLNVADQYIIRVCLVTVINPKTNVRYIHPYDLEDIVIADYNCKQSRSVLFPIQAEDVCGIKSFPNLRIVKKKADELKDHGNLIVFDSSNDNSSPQLASVKDTIKEYQLEKSQLAFTILNKVYINDAVTVIAYAHTTTFSEVMVENINRDPDANNSPSESTCLRSSSLKRPYCSVYKYAPRQGYADSNSEVLIFYRNKLKSDRYGELQVTFEYHGPLGHWQAPVLELEVRDQMVSFITPHFPFKINSITPVNVVIKQQKRTFDQLQYRYIPKNMLCQHCEARLSHMPEPLTQDIPTTSRVADWSIDDEDL